MLVEGMIKYKRCQRQRKQSESEDSPPWPCWCQEPCCAACGWLCLAVLRAGQAEGELEAAGRGIWEEQF